MNLFPRARPEPSAGIALWCLLCAALCCGIPARAQVLAHKNWAGAGISVDAWWRAAEFYEVDPLSFQDANGDGFGDLNGLTGRLDYLETLGVDALVLSPLDVHPGTQPFDAVYGSEDDFARLVSEATERRMRVLVDLPLSPARSAAETLAAARFWLTRGAAGLRLTDGHAASTLPAAERTGRVRDLQRLCATFPGERVLLADDIEVAPIAISTSRRKRQHGSASVASPQTSAMAAVIKPNQQLVESSTFSSTLAATALHVQMLASDAADHARSATRFGSHAARALAAVLLLGKASPLLLFGQEVGMESAQPAEPAPMAWGMQPEGLAGFTTGTAWLEPAPNAAAANVSLEDDDPDSLLNWYRKLGTLRHTQGALHGGSLELLAATAPDTIAWVRRPAHGVDAAPVVVVVNLSPRAVMTSVLQRGETLETLAATYAAEKRVPANGVALPAFGVYVGALRKSAGLETVVLAPRRRHR